MTDTSPTPADRPADQLRAAAGHAPSPELARLLATLADASDHHPTGEGGVVATVVHPALAVARQLLDGAPAPAVWVDGDPLMEAMAAGVYEQCGTDPVSSVVVDDPRNIAAVAAAVARQLLGTTVAEDGRCPVMTPGGRCEKDADHRAGRWPDDPHVPAAPPAPADRAAVLREAADFVGNDDACDCGGCDTCIPRKLADRLRALADGAAAGVQPPTSEAHRPGRCLVMIPGVGRCEQNANHPAPHTPEPTVPAPPADGTRCTCGGRFPTLHLHADTHEPAAPAAPEETQ
ncbi:hypothetical protein [Streptomyces griseus]|uniref:hypothetical protein n=1 Tax=Streptomyces griseus TaxID=1911 RepID=UPI0036BEB04F